jgi:hypothetical protein
MSNLDHAIATQRANLKRRRQWIRARRRDLHRAVGRYCSRPRTLTCAFLTGTALGALSPPRVSNCCNSPNRGNTLRRRQGVVSLQLLVLNLLVGSITRQSRLAEDKQVETAAN